MGVGMRRGKTQIGEPGEARAKSGEHEMNKIIKKLFIFNKPIKRYVN